MEIALEIKLFARFISRDDGGSDCDDEDGDDARFIRSLMKSFFLNGDWKVQEENDDASTENKSIA